MKTKFLIIDGNSLACRALFAHNSKFGPDLQTFNGKLTGGTYRFFTMLDKILHQIKPTHVVVGWDPGGKNFRHSIYKDYKANREKKDPHIFEQFHDMKGILNSIGINNVEIYGYEGDDIVGTYATISEADENYILSGDRDIFQLINDNTFIIYPKNSFREIEILDNKYITEKYGIIPDQFIDFKTLMGDDGDNIPGINGCGEKTASKLLFHYGNIENIINNCNDIQIKGINKTVKDNIIKWIEMSDMIRKLVTIKKDVNVPYNFNNCKVNLKWENAINTFKELEFNSFIRKIKNKEFYTER